RLVLTTPAIVGGFYAAFLLRERRMQRLVLFVALAYVGISAQAKFFWYHFSYMLPFLALLGAWTWDRTWLRLRRTQPAWTAWGTMALLVGGLLLCTPEVADNGYHQWRAYIDYYRHPETREQFYGLFGGYLAER